MIRYKESPDKLQRIANKMTEKYFPGLKEASIKVILDTKKKRVKGDLRFGELKLVDDLNRFFTAQDDFKGYDFVMIIDNMLFENVVNWEDIKRVIFHELNHGGIDDKGKFKIKPHDFEGFYSEIDFNKDDPDWIERLGEDLEEMYSEE